MKVQNALSKIDNAESDVDVAHKNKVGQPIRRSLFQRNVDILKYSTNSHVLTRKCWISSTIKF